MRVETLVVEKPMVSVVMIAYNVESYIRQAIESILMQRVNFSFEIVVGEDCSTDGTRDILLQYAAKHPNVVRPLLREKNLGMNTNFFSTLREHRGKYVALLDGDDYWTSPDKLQKQVDFLEAHPDYSICFHNVMVVYEGGNPAPHPFHMHGRKTQLQRPVPRETSAVEDLLGGNFIQTCSAVFRSGLIREIPDWFLMMPTFDWPLHVCNASHGPVRYLDEIMGAYRVHSGGMWSSNMSAFRRIEDVDRMLQAYAFIDQHFDGRYRQFIHSSTRWLYKTAAHLLYQEGKTTEGNRYLSRYLSGLTGYGWRREKRLLLTLCCANIPVLATLLRQILAARQQQR
jgi:glycosyltransferase involved in cell wall biosynthesis